MKPRHSLRTRLLAFLPAAALVGVVAGTAAGITLIPSAAATDISLTGSVAADITTPADPGGGSNDGDSGRCLANAGAASFTLADGWEADGGATTGTCEISFGSSNGPIQLVYENANVGDSYFYCNKPTPAAPRSCTASGDRVDNVPTNDAIDANTGTPDNRFGIALDSVDGNTSAGTGFTATPTPALTASVWHPVPNNGTPAQLCRSDAAGTATCRFVLGVEGQDTAQNSGDYSGTLRLTATSL